MKFEASLTFSLHQKGALATRPGSEIKAKPRCCQDIVLQCNVYLSLSTLRLDSGAAVLLCLNQRKDGRELAGSPLISCCSCSVKCVYKLLPDIVYTHYNDIHNCIYIYISRCITVYIYIYTVNVCIYIYV